MQINSSNAFGEIGLACVIILFFFLITEITKNKLSKKNNRSAIFSLYTK